MAVTLPLAFLAIRAGRPFVAAFLVSVVLSIVVYRWQTERIRRRRRILSEPFPPEWEVVLEREVVFFRVLDSASQHEFRRQIQIFLAEKRVTGIQCDVDDTTRVLAAASAVIPIFGFPEWEWNLIHEVLVYPNRFDNEFQFGDEQGHNILGMVGTGALDRLMLLSKPDLHEGFRNPADKRNVGFHEFAHLVDKTDGVIDGVPSVGLDRQAIGPWIDLVRRKMAEIEAGDSDIDRYALTSEAEFFAVVAEYFFERPEVLERRHPELHAALERVFNQSFRDRAAVLGAQLKLGRRRFTRNFPCPCDSGLKFKKCCGR